MICVPFYLFILLRTSFSTHGLVVFSGIVYVFIFLIRTYLLIDLCIHSFLLSKLVKTFEKWSVHRKHLHYKFLTRFTFHISTILFFLLSNILYTALTLAQIFVRTVFYFPVSTKLIYRKYSLLKLLHSRTVARLRRIVMDYFTMMTLTVMMGSMMSQRLSLGGSEVGLVLYYTAF